MMTRPQQILLKRAQREAGLDDADYREDLLTIAGCRSSTDARMTDRHLDKALAYFEAIHWRKADRGELQPSCKPDAVFRQRGFWAAKNTRGNTSRDRFAAGVVAGQIASREASLAELGFGESYCAAIRETVTQGRNDPRALHQYAAALERTLNAKRRKISSGQLVR